MKSFQIIAFGMAITAAVSQAPQDLPDCGKLCVNNMLAKAREFGCTDGDAACLCRNIDFAYGIRDCSTQVCGPQQAVPVIAYGENYCKAAGSGGSGSGTGNGSGSGSSGSAIPTGPSSTGLDPLKPLPSMTTETSILVPGATSAVTTSAIVSTVTSGADLYTTTLGFTTLYSNPNGPEQTGTSTGKGESSETVTSTSIASPTKSGEGDSPTSSSSTGSAAKQTVYAGLAAAAGLAAMIL